MKWPKIDIMTPQGVKSALAPAVISASRATDIPAFHAKWFINRIQAGYCLWQNPFNSKQQQYISFEKCKIFVFWTKNAAPFMPFLTKLDERGYKYYFQYTINDYDLEKLEPRLANLQARLDVFQELSERIGKHRVLWRFDPIILSNTLTIEKTLEKFERVAKNISPYTDKCIFSFVDWYKKTENHLKKIDVSYRAPHEQEMHRIARGIMQINSRLAKPLKISTCAEDLALSYMDIARNKCIDPELLAHLCPQDEDILKLCGDDGKEKQFSMLTLPKKDIKDSGQRSACGCAPSKDIGSYNSCLHFCTYCYANQSEQAVLNKVQNSNINSEIL